MSSESGVVSGEHGLDVEKVWRRYGEGMEKMQRYGASQAGGEEGLGKG